MTPPCSTCTAAVTSSVARQPPASGQPRRAEPRRSWALALDYRLAPEHPFPAAVDDAVSGYRYLLSRGIRPGRIAIAGDGAGGGLVVAAMLAIREAAGYRSRLAGGASHPGSIWKGSASRCRPRPRLGPDGTERRVFSKWPGSISDGADPHSPLAAPIYADLKGLAPVLIQVGAAETLLDDAIRLAKVAGAADVRVDLQVWPEMVHVWHIFHPELKAGPQGDRTRREAIRPRHDGKLNRASTPG